jgi:hypothetical protein
MPHCTVHAETLAPADAATAGGMLQHVLQSIETAANIQLQLLAGPKLVVPSPPGAERLSS